MTNIPASQIGAEIARLNGMLDDHGRRYFASRQCETEDRQAAIVAVADALACAIELIDLIPAEPGPGRTALHDLLCALHALAEGGDPLLLRKTGSGRGHDSPAARQVQYSAVLCVTVLVATGMKESAARKYVAAAFARAGHRGRKGDPLSAGTIAEWMLKCGEAGVDPQGNQWFAEHMAEWRRSPDWPPSIAVAKRWVDQRPNDWSLISKI